MEDKLKWRRLKEFLFGLLGYFLGTIIHSLGGYSGHTSRTLFGITFVVIIRALYDIYKRFRYPEVIRKERQLDKDERNMLIQYRTANIAINVTMFTLAIVWLIGVILKNNFLAYFAVAVIGCMIVVMELSRYFLNNKM
ncbi:MAG: DUF2178 domain-containing protein [Clostridiales bacterium]|nr:DUF2178 domain-containing protein [Clostridiales bacterium]